MATDGLLAVAELASLTARSTSVPNIIAMCIIRYVAICRTCIYFLTVSMQLFCAEYAGVDDVGIKVWSSTGVSRAPLPAEM